MPVTLDRERFVETMKEQAEIGPIQNGGLHRLTLSDDDKRIRDWFREQMEAERTNKELTTKDNGGTLGERPSLTKRSGD